MFVGTGRCRCNPTCGIMPHPNLNECNNMSVGTGRCRYNLTWEIMLPPNLNKFNNNMCVGTGQCRYNLTWGIMPPPNLNECRSIKIHSIFKMYICYSAYNKLNSKLETNYNRLNSKYTF